MCVCSTKYFWWVGLQLLSKTATAMAKCRASECSNSQGKEQDMKIMQRQSGIAKW